MALQEPRVMRAKLKMNQAQFWGPLGVTQSGGSRYESGRAIPAPVLKLMEIAYGTEKQSEKAIQKLRASAQPKKA